MKLIINILLVLLVFFSINSYAQRSKTEDHLSDSEKEIMAEEALSEGNYEKAVLLYKKLLDNKPDDSMLNFLVGFCYLNTDYGKEPAITHFENALANMKGGSSNNAPLETHYYLAEAYYDVYKFNEAIEVLNEVSAKIPKKANLFKFRVKSLKEKCENGNNISQNKLKIKLENLFDINTKYSDHSPSVNMDESEMIFTSRRAGTNERIKSADGQFDQNIYFSLKIDSAWQSPFSLSNTVNSTNHESVTFISADFKTMIIQKNDRTKGSLYLSKWQESGEWGSAVAFGPNINTKYRETSACLSPDGQKLYFTSDRKGGFGGLDIYVSQKTASGTWDKAKNLGPTINTAFNEETPFIHMNGTLFFCSEGHNSMGGFDIFSSSMNDKNKWSYPVNMAIPINSVQDDFFYRPSLTGRFAYLASKRRGGKGNSDIYRVELINPQKNNYVVVSGRIDISKQNIGLNEVKIHVDDESGKRIKTYKPALKNNLFSLYLKTGKSYKISFEFQELITHKINVSSENYGSFLSLEQHITLDNIYIKSLEDVEYKQMLSRGGNIKTLEYSVKPKSNNNLLADNITNGKTTGNNIDKENTDQPKKYSIQLLNSKTTLSKSYFGDIQDVKSHTESNGSYTYYFGEYVYEWEATIKLRMIKNKYPNAKIFVNTFNQKKID